MAEKKMSKAAATKAAKKEATKAAPEEKAPVKKCATRKAATAKESIVYYNAENAGFKAGDVYQVLAAAEKALTVAEIAKKAKTTAEDVLLGLGWLLKEGKVTSTEDNKIVLA